MFFSYNKLSLFVVANPIGRLYFELRCPLFLCFLVSFVPKTWTSVDYDGAIARMS